MKTRLADMMKRHRISQADVRRATGVPRATLCQALHDPDRQMPRKYRPGIETFLREKGIDVCELWSDQGDETQEEVEIMRLSAKTKRDYKIERSPFLRDVRSNDEMYENEGFLGIQAALTDVAENGGFLLVTGKSGAGKTEHLLWLQERYRSENGDGPVQVCAIQMLDRDKINASHVYARMLYDIEGEAKRQNAEVRHEQLLDALEKQHAENRMVVCAVDDGQDLHPATIRALRRFAGLRSKADRTRLLSVVIFAQPGLRGKLARRADLREVTNRIDEVEIVGLFGADDIEAYLRSKFEHDGVLRKGQTLGAIFDKAAFEALAEEPRSRTPQELHLLVTKVMNHAAKIGGTQARKITREVVEDVLRIKGGDGEGEE